MMLKAAALSLAFLVFLPLPAFAADPQDETGNIVGTILGAEGITTATQMGQRPAAARAGMPVYPGDLLASGPRARLFVQMIDDTEITLGAGSQLTIDAYEFNGEGKKGNRAAYTLLKGDMLYTGGLIGRDNHDTKIVVTIPYGSFTFSDGKIWAGMIDADFGILAAEGRATIDTAVGRARLAKGQGSFLRDKGAPPGPVSTWPDDRVDAANTTVKLKNPQSLGPRLQQAAARNPALRERHRHWLEARAPQSDTKSEKPAPTAQENAAAQPQKSEPASAATSQQTNPAAPLPPVIATPKPAATPAGPAATPEKTTRTTTAPETSPTPAATTSPAPSLPAPSAPVVTSPAAPGKPAPATTPKTTATPVQAQPLFPAPAAKPANTGTSEITSTTRTPMTRSAPEIAAPAAPATIADKPAAGAVVRAQPMARPQTTTSTDFGSTTRATGGITKIQPIAPARPRPPVLETPALEATGE